MPPEKEKQKKARSEEAYNENVGTIFFSTTLVNCSERNSCSRAGRMWDSALYELARRFTI